MDKWKSATDCDTLRYVHRFPVMLVSYQDVIRNGHAITIPWISMDAGKPRHHRKRVSFPRQRIDYPSLPIAPPIRPISERTIPNSIVIMHGSPVFRFLNQPRLQLLVNIH